MGVTNFDIVQANLFLGPTAALNPFGQFFYVDAYNGSDTNDGTGPDSAYATLNKALDQVVSNRGDVVYVYGFTDELVALELGTHDGLTIIGAGGRGSAGVASTAVGSAAMDNNANDVTLINFGVASEASASYNIRVQGNRMRGYGCKFEGVETSGDALLFVTPSIAQHAAGQTTSASDCLFVDCELAWSFNGMEFIASDFGKPTQNRFENCRLHNLSNVEMLGTPGAFGIGSVANLEVVNCTFGRMEDGTAPSDYVKVDDASDTGYFTGNSFALATNAAADLKIGAGILWMANATEAGLSTARPA